MDSAVKGRDIPWDMEHCQKVREGTMLKPVHQQFATGDRVWDILCVCGDSVVWLFGVGVAESVERQGASLSILSYVCGCSI